jgi:hypothetical protein
VGQNPEALTVQIADITFKFLIDNPCINNDIKEKYVHFLVEEEPDILVETQIITEFMAGDNFLPDIRHEDHLSLIERPDFHARYDGKTGACSLKLKDSIYSFESFCRIFLTDYLLRRDGFLLHATALIRKEKGYIFTGASGSGKSTIGALSPDNILLSDEIIIVRKMERRYRVYGTPFISKFMTGGVNRGIDVDKLFYLNKSPKHFTEKLSEKAALSKFLGNTVFFSRSKSDNMQIFLICSDFISSVPSFDLYFKPENSVWQVIEEA